MATSVFIYSYQRLSEPCIDLEDDLEDFLSGAGEITGGGGGSVGWNIDLELRDAADVEHWVERLAGFLRDRGCRRTPSSRSRPRGRSRAESTSSPTGTGSAEL